MNFLYIFFWMSISYFVDIQTKDIEQTKQTVDQKYTFQKTTVAGLKDSLRQVYLSETTTAGKDKILKLSAEKFTYALINQLIPSWYGTPWAFYGMTETPRQGNIACGYFVTTLLRDAGVKLERVDLAKLASGYMIDTLVTKQHQKKYSNWTYAKFEADVIAQGDGLYIVGLDIHTGFILVEGGTLFFIHSSYINPWCVVRQNGSQSPILMSSKYRVTGKVSADKNFLIKRWLQV